MTEPTRHNTITPTERKTRRDIGRRAKQRGASEERAALEPLSKFFGEAFKRTGNRGTSSADVTSATYCVEIKSRIRPTWSELTGAWGQAIKAAQETGLEPWVMFSFKEKDGKRVRWIITKLDEGE